MHILVIAANPRKDSYTQALADAYARGAIQAGQTVDLVSLTDLEFNPDVIEKHPQHQFLESDLKQMQEKISAADHLVFVYPTWWGTVPAVLKGFLDRVLTPGFAFRELNYGNYDKMLKGRSAQIITTMDTPVFVFKYLQQAPGTRTMRISTLNFCGISPVRSKHFSPVNYAEPEKLDKWLKETEEMGYRLKNGFLTWSDKFWIAAMPWIKLLRLQFYPLTLVTFITGLAVGWSSGNSNWFAIIGAYVIMFLIEAATVFSNELRDVKSDEINENFGPFTGGSRVLIDKELSAVQVTKVRNILLIAAFLLTAVLLFVEEKNQALIGGIIALNAILGLGYSLKPLQLSYRGLGAITVGLTHGISPLLLGYWLTGSPAWNAPVMWLGLLLSISVLPGIILSGIPDMAADKKTNKNTEAVLLGIQNTSWLTIGLSAFTIVLAVVMYHSILHEFLSVWVYFLFFYGVFFIYKVWQFIRAKKESGRMDTLMVYALLLMFIMGMIPFLKVVFS